MLSMCGLLCSMLRGWRHEQAVVLMARALAKTQSSLLIEDISTDHESEGSDEAKAGGTSPFCAVGGESRLSQLLWRDNNKQAVIIAPKQCVNLQRWTLFLSAENSIQTGCCPTANSEANSENGAAATEEIVTVLLEASYRERDAEIGSDYHVMVEHLSRPYAWKARDVFGVIVTTTPPQLLAMIQAFFNNALLIDDDFLVKKILTIETVGEPATLEDPLSIPESVTPGPWRSDRAPLTQLELARNASPLPQGPGRGVWSGQEGWRGNWLRPPSRLVPLWHQWSGESATSTSTTVQPQSSTDSERHQSSLDPQSSYDSVSDYPTSDADDPPCQVSGLYPRGWAVSGTRVVSGQPLSVRGALARGALAQHYKCSIVTNPLEELWHEGEHQGRPGDDGCSSKQSIVCSNGPSSDHQQIRSNTLPRVKRGCKHPQFCLPSTALCKSIEQAPIIRRERDIVREAAEYYQRAINTAQEHREWVKKSTSSASEEEDFSFSSDRTDVVVTREPRKYPVRIKSEADLGRATSIIRDNLTNIVQNYLIKSGTSPSPESQPLYPKLVREHPTIKVLEVAGEGGTDVQILGSPGDQCSSKLGENNMPMFVKFEEASKDDYGKGETLIKVTDDESVQKPYQIVESPVRVMIPLVRSSGRSEKKLTKGEEIVLPPITRDSPIDLEEEDCLSLSQGDLFKYGGTLVQRHDASLKEKGPSDSKQIDSEAQHSTPAEDSPMSKETEMLSIQDAEQSKVSLIEESKSKGVEMNEKTSHKDTLATSTISCEMHGAKIPDSVEITIDVGAIERLEKITPEPVHVVKSMQESKKSERVTEDSSSNLILKEYEHQKEDDRNIEFSLKTIKSMIREASPKDVKIEVNGLENVRDTILADEKSDDNKFAVNQISLIGTKSKNSDDFVDIVCDSGDQGSNDSISDIKERRITTTTPDYDPQSSYIKRANVSTEKIVDHTVDIPVIINGTQGSEGKVWEGLNDDQSSTSVGWPGEIEELSPGDDGESSHKSKYLKDIHKLNTKSSTASESSFESLPYRMLSSQPESLSEDVAIELTRPPPENERLKAARLELIRQERIHAISLMVSSFAESEDRGKLPTPEEERKEIEPSSCCSTDTTNTIITTNTNSLQEKSESTEAVDEETPSPFWHTTFTSHQQDDFERRLEASGTDSEGGGGGQQAWGSPVLDSGVELLEQETGQGSPAATQCKSLASPVESVPESGFSSLQEVSAQESVGDGVRSGTRAPGLCPSKSKDSLDLTETDRLLGTDTLSDDMETLSSSVGDVTLVESGPVSQEGSSRGSISDPFHHDPVPIKSGPVSLVQLAFSAKESVLSQQEMCVEKDSRQTPPKLSDSNSKSQNDQRNRQFSDSDSISEMKISESLSSDDTIATRRSLDEETTIASSLEGFASERPESNTESSILISSRALHNSIADKLRLLSESEVMSEATKCHREFPSKKVVCISSTCETDCKSVSQACVEETGGRRSVSLPAEEESSVSGRKDSKELEKRIPNGTTRCRRDGGRSEQSERSSPSRHSSRSGVSDLEDEVFLPPPADVTPPREGAAVPKMAASMFVPSTQAVRQGVRSSQDEGRGSQDGETVSQDEGRGSLDGGTVSQDEGKGSQDGGRGSQDGGKISQDERRGSQDEETVSQEGAKCLAEWEKEEGERTVCVIKKKWDRYEQEGSMKSNQEESRKDSQKSEFKSKEGKNSVGSHEREGTIIGEKYLKDSQVKDGLEKEHEATRERGGKIRREREPEESKKSDCTGHWESERKSSQEKERKSGREKRHKDLRETVCSDSKEREHIDTKEKVYRDSKEKESRHSKEKDCRDSMEKEQRHSKEKESRDSKEKEFKDHKENERRNSNEKEHKERRDSKEKERRDSKEKEERDSKEKEYRDSKEKERRDSREKKHRDSKEKESKEKEHKERKDSKEKERRNSREKERRHSREKERRDSKEKEHKERRESKEKERRDSKEKEHKEHRDSKEKEHKERIDSKEKEHKERRDSKEKEHKEHRDSLEKEHKERRDSQEKEYKECRDSKEKKLIEIQVRSRERCNQEERLKNSRVPSVESEKHDVALTTESTGKETLKEREQIVHYSQKELLKEKQEEGLKGITTEEELQSTPKEGLNGSLNEECEGEVEKIGSTVCQEEEVSRGAIECVRGNENEVNVSQKRERLHQTSKKQQHSQESDKGLWSSEDSNVDQGVGVSSEERKETLPDTKPRLLRMAKLERVASGLQSEDLRTKQWVEKGTTGEWGQNQGSPPLSHTSQQQQQQQPRHHRPVSSAHPISPELRKCGSEELSVLTLTSTGSSTSKSYLDTDLSSMGSPVCVGGSLEYLEGLSGRQRQRSNTNPAISAAKSEDLSARWEKVSIKSQGSLDKFPHFDQVSGQPKPRGTRRKIMSVEAQPTQTQDSSKEMQRSVTLPSTALPTTTTTPLSRKEDKKKDKDEKSVKKKKKEKEKDGGGSGEKKSAMLSLKGLLKRNKAKEKEKEKETSSQEKLSSPSLFRKLERKSKSGSHSPTPAVASGTIKQGNANQSSTPIATVDPAFPRSPVHVVANGKTRPVISGPVSLKSVVPPASCSDSDSPAHSSSPASPQHRNGSFHHGANGSPQRWGAHTQPSPRLYKHVLTRHLSSSQESLDTTGNSQLSSNHSSLPSSPHGSPRRTVLPNSASSLSLPASPPAPVMGTRALRGSSNSFSVTIGFRPQVQERQRTMSEGADLDTTSQSPNTRRRDASRILTQLNKRSSSMEILVCGKIREHHPETSQSSGRPRSSFSREGSFRLHREISVETLFEVPENEYNNYMEERRGSCWSLAGDANPSTYPRTSKLSLPHSMHLAGWREAAASNPNLQRCGSPLVRGLPHSSSFTSSPFRRPQSASAVFSPAKRGFTTSTGGPPAMESSNGGGASGVTLMRVEEEEGPSRRNLDPVTEKPPNVLVYAANKTEYFNAVRDTLSQCLNSDRYIVYHLTDELAFKSPWCGSTTLLVVCGDVPAHISTAFIRYLLQGGRILSICSDFLNMAIPLFGTVEVQEQAVVSVSYKEWSSVQLLHHQHCFHSSPRHKRFSQEVDNAKAEASRSGAVSVEPTHVEIIDEYGGQHRLDLRVLATDDTWAAPTLLAAQLHGGIGSAIFSQVHLERDPRECYSSPAPSTKQDHGSMKPSPSTTERLSTSNQARLEMLRDLLASELGLDTSSSVTAVAQHTPAYFLGRHELKESLLNQLRPHMIGEELKRSGITVQFVEPNNTPKEASEHHLPILTSACPLTFSTVKYFETLKTTAIGRLVIYCDVMTSSQEITAGHPPLVHGIVVLPTQQTKGKGRGGNAWVSPLGCAMFSTQLHIHLSSLLGQHLSFLQHLVSLAVVQAVRDLPAYSHIPLTIKWPNDIYLGREVKIGGILVEVTTLGSQVIANVGCGVNLSNSNPTVCINDAVRQHNLDHNTSLPELDRETFLARVFNALENLIDTFQSKGPGAVQPLYYKYWLHSNATVTVQSEQRHAEAAVIVGVDDYGFLQAQLVSGAIISLQPDGNTFNMMEGLVYAKTS
ncbi:hypothetical protein Pmani_009649 [Petrolisthes manimaculis]|uniref:BPL/LPL catalytic domain-containing protein n=1 Tax=Petrolisthes manimaculis TaxID=1843537 RepID=A0AAE1UI66_9EUCA|nr:hypothetical protein Pmani_009649 [Petrolisthes manimaculis]